MSGERVGSYRGANGALQGEFRVGSGDAAVNMGVGDGHRPGERSMLGRSLDRLSRANASVDIRFGSSTVGTLQPAQLATLARMTSTTERRNAIADMLRAQFPPESHPNFDYAGNAVRVMNGISRVDPTSVREGSVLTLRLPADSNEAVEGNFERGTPARLLGTIPASSTSPTGSLQPPSTTPPRR
jgi:hypothetical protein